MLVAVQHAQAGSGAPALTDQLIVKFAVPAVHGAQTQPGPELLDRLRVRAGMSLDPLRMMSNDAWVMVLPERVSDAIASAIAGRLAGDPDVEYAVADRFKRPGFVPDDAFYTQQWNLFEDAGGTRLPEAWDRERGAPEIVIAMIDTGILYDGDLDTGRFAPGYDFIGDPAIANDGDGRDADPGDPGDWVAAGECGEGQPAQPSSWHGTSVTGIIGALTDNSEGIAGVNHGSRLLMARALGKCGGYTSDLIDATRWAAGLRVPGVPDNANPARVINLSFGGEGACGPLEQDTIDEISARGAVVIAAAGNESGDVASYSPGNCNNVVTVAATTRSGARAWYTNTGNRVDVSAPGGDLPDPLLSTGNSGTMTPVADAIVNVAGTSFAAAHVSGIAGLVLAANGELNSRQVREILVSSARPFPDASCDPLTCGNGIVDANAAVQLAMITQGQPDSDGDGVNDEFDLCADTPAGEPVDADGCSASQLDDGTGGGGGGGGCTIANAGALDPLLCLLLLVSILGLAKARHFTASQQTDTPAGASK